MRALIALCLSALSIVSYHNTAMQTFTSPDGAFQFKYSSALIHCTLQQGSWIPGDACTSQDGICDDDASSATTIACFAYPKRDFRDKPEFSAAAFFVAEVQAATTPKSCLEGSPNWLVEKTQNAAIQSVRAKLFTISDAWTGGGQTGKIYRVFRGNTCYEFGIQQARMNIAAFDPGTIKKFTKQDADQVHTVLQQSLDSFGFLK
jgi:hypothetical protein